MEQLLHYPESGISPKSYFYLSNGQIIKSLEELPYLIERLDEKTFQSHVTAYKNDFAKWVNDVFMETELAAKMGPVKSREEMIRLIKAHLLHSKLNNDLNQVVKPEPLKAEPELHTIETIIKPKAEAAPEITSPEQQVQQAQTSETAKENNEKTASVSEPEKNIPKKTDEAINKTSANETDDPDDFFRKNPVLMDQAVDARKENLIPENLDKIEYGDLSDIKKVSELFKDTYAKSYQKMGFMRKNGFDTGLVEIMIMRIPSKIKIFEATGAEKDALAAKRYLNEAIEELNNLKQ